MSDLIKDIREKTARTISILGDSISSYNGISNNTAYNSTLEKHPAYYSTSMDKSDLSSVNDTYWMRAINTLGLELCVPNGCAASRVTNTVDNNRPGYEYVISGITRAPHLHKDGENPLYPDIISVLLGTNDIGNAVHVSDFELGYRTMLSILKDRYRNAEIYVGTLVPQSRAVTPETNNEYNATIKKVALEFGVNVVDYAAESGITFDNYLSYTADGLHPNNAGMQRLSECLINALKRDL